jgi:DNA anti-recombination protein RmuC
VDSLEGETRSQAKKLTDLEKELRTVKQDCYETLASKELALTQSYRSFEARNQELHTAMEGLKQQLDAQRVKYEQEIREIGEEHSHVVRDKERAIRQVKGERDSLFEEVKAQERTLRSKDVSPNRNINRLQNTHNSAKSGSNLLSASGSNPFSLNQGATSKMLSKVYTDLKYLPR